MKRFRDRVARVQQLMREEGVGLTVLSPGPDMLYLSGFSDQAGERLLLFFVPPEGEPRFIVPELYLDQVREQSPFHPVHVWRDADGPSIVLDQALADLGAGKARVLVDDSMGARFILMLEATLPGAAFALASPLMCRLRMKKSSGELQALSEAAAIADRAFEELSQTKITGMTELAVARALETIMMREGADAIAFETLVASGPNSALPHHRAGRRAIEPGDVVFFDYGCRVGGYCSDITRTVVCGDPPARVQAIHDLVSAAQEQAVAAVRPGVAAQEIDRIARGVITKAGHGAHFIHRTGHGIGLDVHEEPYIVEGNELRLERGMTFSIEPGIYLPGEFGVRVEDIVVVTDAGSRWLNNCSRALQSVG